MALSRRHFKGSNYYSNVPLFFDVYIDPFMVSSLINEYPEQRPPPRHNTVAMVALCTAQKYAMKRLQARLHLKRRRGRMVDITNTFYRSQVRRPTNKMG